MKKFITCFLGLSLLLSGCVNSNQSSNDDDRLYQYESAEDGYSFSLEKPAGWDEVHRGRTIVGFVPEADQTMAVEMLAVYVDDLRDDPMNFADYSKMYQGLLEGAGLVDEMVEESDLSVADTSAKKFVYVDSVTDENGNEIERVKTQEIWGMIDEVVFSLVYHADEGNFDKYRDEVDQAIESFEFEVKK